MKPLIKIWYIILKNIKFIIRSRVSALVFFFGPLLLLFLIGLAFNTSNIYDLSIGFYTSSPSELSNSIKDTLNQHYNINDFNNEEECKNAVKFNEIQACLILPPSMALDNSGNNKIRIILDNTRINIANLIGAEMGAKFSSESQELSKTIISQILTVLDNINKNIVLTQDSIKTLESSNAESKEIVSSLQEELSAIDLSYSSFDTAQISSEISEIQSAYNISSSAFSKLNSLITSLSNSYTSTTSKLSSAKQSIDRTASTASSISSSLSSQTNVISSIKSNIDASQAEISNIKLTNVASIVSPITYNIEPITANRNYLLYVWPSLIALLLMFIALLLAATTIVAEKTSKAYFRSYITPTSSTLFVLGALFSVVLIILIQTIIILAISYFFFDFSLQTYAKVFLAIIPFSFAFVLLGMLFGYIFNTKQTAILGAVSFSLILIFFSNFVLPLEVLSSNIRNILAYNPYVIGELLIKKLFVFGISISNVAVQFYTLIGLSVILFGIAILCEKFLNKV